MTFKAANHDRAAGHFEDFAEAYGEKVADDTLQRVCEAAYYDRGRKSGADECVTIASIHRHDAINMTFEGTVKMPDGVEYDFVIDDGNWNGTVVREWGLAGTVEAYEPPKPDPYRLIPGNRDTLRAHRKGLWQVYLLWRKESWFTDAERGYNYDRHFAPGSVTEAHYTGPNSVATKRGLVWMHESDVEAYLARPDSDFDNVPSPEAVRAFAAEMTALLENENTA